MAEQRVSPVLLLTLFLAVAVGSFASKHHSGSGSSSSRADNTPGQFDYYQLTLSWAPEFCATHGANRSSSECDPNKHFGLIVHGLWPQNEDGSWPSDCQNASPVSNEIVREMLPIMPARGLIQHEWAKHGTCSGLSTQNYFSRVQQLYRQVKIPPQLQRPKQVLDLDPRKIEQSFTDANHAPQGAFRVSCRNGDLVEISACFTKDFRYRACGMGSGKCNVPQVKVLPTP
jgi:ribonuclease T2